MVSYRYVLVARWSRRDRLGVVGIALAVALLVGTTLLLSAVGTQTTAMAAGLGSNTTVEGYDSPSEARQAAADRSVVVLLHRTSVQEGRNVTVVGVPAEANGTTVGDATLPETPPPDRLAGPTDPVNGTLALRTTDGDTATLAVVSGNGGAALFPDSWYVARASTADRLPVEGALVITPRDAPARASRSREVPVVSTVAFFVAGTRGVLEVLWPLAGGAAVLSGVVVFSVTRMSVRDRLETVHLARATGAPPRTILALVTLRATAMTLVGVAVGYALGVILPVAAVSGATSAGLPTTIHLRVTGRMVARVAPPLAGIVLVGAGAGALAGRPAGRAAPAALIGGGGTARPAAGPPPSGTAVEDPTREDPTTGGSEFPPNSDDDETGDPGFADRVECRVRSTLELAVLDYRAAVPTAATLSVFVAAVLVVTALAGTVAPLAGADEATIVEPDAIHPVNSRVEVGYADALRDDGVAASPEILSFQVAGGDPFLVRGANYTAFARVSGARLVRGRKPAGPTEAVVGADLAAALGVEPGDRLLLGGRSAPRLSRVEVVGVYRAPGLEDDQLVVPLVVARHLTGTAPGQVDFIRLDRSLSGTGSPPGSEGSAGDGGPNRSPLVVTNVSVRRTDDRERVRVGLTVRNFLSDAHEGTLAVHLADRSTTRRITVPGSGRRTVAVTLAAPPPGTYRLRVTDPERPGADPFVRRSVTLRDPDALAVGRVPGRAPPNATLLVPVRDGRGRPVANATVRIGDERATTTEAGLARVRVPAPGTYEVTAARSGGDGGSARRELAVERGVRRSLLVDATVTPTDPSVGTRPTVRVRVGNPWGRTIERTVRVSGPGATHHQRVRLAPGERTTIAVELGRAAPGRHELAVTVDGRTATRREYVVRGGERVVSALATGGYYRGASGLGGTVRTALGNLEVLLGTLLGLVAVATVGTVAAGFAATVHARRETVGIYRATGATGPQVLAVVLGDAVRVTAVAVPPALVVGFASVVAVRSLGWLTVFGVTATNAAPARTLLGAAVGSLAVALAGAVVATWPLLRAPPADVLDRAGPVAPGTGTGTPGRPTTTEDRDEWTGGDRDG